MPAHHWTQRVNPTPQELADIRSAARDLAQAPGKAGSVFQSVYEVIFLGTAALTGTVAAVHLWKSLCRRHHPGPAPSHAATAASAHPSPQHVDRHYGRGRE